MIVTAIVLSLVAAPTGELRAGDVCELGTTLRATENADGSGATVLLNAGAEVAIEEVRGAVLRVRHGAGTGIDGVAHVKRAAATKWCTVVQHGPRTASPVTDPVAAAAKSAGELAAASSPPPAAPSHSPSPTRAEAADAERPAPGPITAAPGGPGAASATGPGSQPASSAFTSTQAIKVAVMDLKASASIASDLVTSLTAAIPRTLQRLGPFDAVTSREVVQLLSYQAARQQLGGCEDLGCLSQMGDALGADFLITGDLTETDGSYVLQLQLTEIANATVRGRVEREYRGEARALFGEVRNATEILVRDLLALRTGMLSLDVSEEGATVVVDNDTVGVSPMGILTLAGGRHALGVSKDGFVRYRADINIIEDQVLPVTVRLLPSADFVESYRDRAGLVRNLSWISMGAGAALVVVSVGLFAGGEAAAGQLNRDVDAYNLQVDRTTAESDALQGRAAQIATLDALSVTSLTVGVVAIGVGVALRFLGADPGRYDALTSVSSGPTAHVVVGPGALGIGGSF